LRGVMGPSWPLRAGLMPLGDGVRASRRAILGVEAFVVAPARLAAGVGMLTGSEVACDVDGRSGDEGVVCVPESPCIVTSIESGSCTDGEGAAERVAAAAAAAWAIRTLLAESLDFRGAADGA
jgi:hypothetical protein